MEGRHTPFFTLPIIATAYCLLFSSYGKKIIRNNTHRFRRRRIDHCRRQFHKRRKRSASYQGDPGVWHPWRPVLHRRCKPYSNYKRQTFLVAGHWSVVTRRNKYKPAYRQLATTDRKLSQFKIFPLLVRLPSQMAEDDDLNG